MERFNRSPLDKAGTSHTSMAAVSKRYTKVKGFADTKGQMFEVKMSALLFLRGLNSGRPFQLASNVEGAGAFDDIVFKYQPLDTDHPACWHTYFLQLKHKSHAKVQIQALSAPRGDFSIKKYFESFLKVKETMCQHDKEEMFRGSLEDCSFILYTNASLSTDLLNRKVNDICQVDNILKTKKCTEHVIVLSQELDPDIVASLDGEDKVDTQNFLKSLKKFSGAPTVDDLDDLIEDEILEACGLNKSDAQRVVSIFLEEFQKWCQTSDLILDENSDILERAVSIRNLVVLEPQQRKDLTLDLDIQEQYKTDMKDALSKNNSILNFVRKNVIRKISTSNDKMIKTRLS